MVSQREREKNRRIFPSRFFLNFFLSLSLSLGFKTLKMESFFFEREKDFKRNTRKKEFLGFRVVPSQVETSPPRAYKLSCYTTCGTPLANHHPSRRQKRRRVFLSSHTSSSSRRAFFSCDQCQAHRRCFSRALRTKEIAFALTGRRSRIRGTILDD